MAGDDAGSDAGLAPPPPPAFLRPGAIIILHDRGVRGERTATVLSRVLPVLQARGYAVVTLSEVAASSDGRIAIRTRPK